jgi:hypothetical protein
MVTPGITALIQIYCKSQMMTVKHSTAEPMTITVVNPITNVAGLGGPSLHQVFD